MKDSIIKINIADNMAASLNVSDDGATTENSGGYAMNTMTKLAEEDDGPRSSRASNGDLGKAVPQSKTDKAAEEDEGTMPHGKFHYDPQEFERSYYDQLFDLAKVKSDDDSIVPPKDAAKLFVSSGIPPDKLRMIWNMAVLPARPYSAGIKPPPTMNVEQFRVAVRLIQLYQNRITAKDECLRVPSKIVLAPAYFSGVSGELVPLPWNGDEGRKDSATNNTKANASGRAFTLTKTYSTDTDTSILNSQPGNNRHNKPYETERLGSITSNMRILNLKPKRRSTDPIAPLGEERMGGQTRRSTLPGESRQFLLTCDSPEISWPNDDYFMNESDSELYRNIFLMHCISDEDVPSQQRMKRIRIHTAIRLYEESGLSRDILRKIWDVVVADPDLDFLNEVEFVLISHLISCVTEGGHAVPTVLPPPLRKWKNGQLARLSNQKSNEFVPIIASHSSIADDEDSIANYGSKFDQPTSSGQLRLTQLENDISALKQTVLSLRLDVQELKNAFREIISVRRQSGSTHTSDEQPTVDVEMYWDRKKYGTSPKPETSTTDSSPATANIPSSSMRSMSRNVPSVHPVQLSTEERSQNLYQPKMPQARLRDTIIESSISRDNRTRIGDNGSARRIHHSSNGDSGSATSSTRHSRQSQTVPTFQPDLRSTMMSYHKQKQVSLNRLESSRHITRSKSGETEVYKTREPPSTAAVDLPPL